MTVAEVVKKMVEYSKGDLHDINHFMKVYAYAKTIAEGENLSPEQQKLVEVTAVVHDIACPLCRKKYGSADGKHQELEGPAEAEKVLKKLNYANEDISRICYLVSHHHTYDNIDAVDLQILIEADFLVNLFEDNATYLAINTAYSKIFKTDTGKYLCKVMYNLES